MYLLLIVPLCTCYWLFLSAPVTGYSSLYLLLVIPLYLLLVIPLCTSYWLFLSVPVTVYSSLYLLLFIPLCTCYWLQRGITSNRYREE
jgi:hypothetical protein